MAGITFAAGQSMTRPGIYNRYVQVTSPLFAGASDGIAACAIAAQWGPLGEVTEIAGIKQAVEIFGGDGELFRQLLAGGAGAIYAVRAGSGGSRATGTLKDASGAQAVALTARYAGTRAIKYALGSTESGARQLEITENGAVLERITFAAGGDEAAALVAAGAESEYIEFAIAQGYAASGGSGDEAQTQSGTGTSAPGDTDSGDAQAAGDEALLADVTETALTGGVDPQADADDYAAALDMLTPYAWNCVCVDSADVQIHAALHAYMTAAAADGHMGFAVIGEGVNVALDTRIKHARAFNDYRIVYVGGGWIGADGARVDGWRAAARVAGMIACVPSSRSITHRAISGAVKCAEALTNSQYVACTQAGMLTLSASPGALVWVENGITTLNMPMGEDDRGWMKIKRAKIRFELMDRANATVAPMIGNVANDADGRAAVVQAIQGLLRAMAAEGKLLPGAEVYADPDTPPAGDSAGFIIEVSDVDALEKVYFTYQFSFAQQ